VQYRLTHYVGRCQTSAKKHGEEAEESEEGTILKVLSVQCIGVQYGHQHAEEGTYNGDEKAVEIGSPQLVS
jgi:hypothetical protein